MANLDLTDEDRAEIKSILIKWREEGNQNPVLPADVDLDGDGIVDGFGLGDDDEVVIVSGVSLSGTVYQSDTEEGGVE